MSKLKLFVIGGLGDVSLTRKYKVLLQNGLSEKFELSGIADIYDSSRLKGKEGIDKLLWDISKTRLKGELDEKIVSLVRNQLLNGTGYFQLDPSSFLLPEIFLSRINEGVVDISTPNAFHLPFLKQVLEKTRAHVLVEKPIVKSLEEAIELEEFLQSVSLDGRVVMDAEHYTHYGNVRYFMEHMPRMSRNCGLGYNLGKIKKIDIFIEEEETFKSDRNKEIIEIKKSGGGIWLDMGIHAMAFLRGIGAKLDTSTLWAESSKVSSVSIAGKEYGETSMKVGFNLIPNEVFADNCLVYLSIGKAKKETKKEFDLKYERGNVLLKMPEKSIDIYNEYGMPLFHAVLHKDAFYHVFDELRRCIEYGRKPLTAIDKAIQNVKDVFMIYGKAERESL